MDPAKNYVFLWWVVDQVKTLAKDPQFQKDFEAWQRQREAAKAGSSGGIGQTETCPGLLTGVSTGTK